MSQASFAALLGISQSGIAMLESRDALPEKHQRTIRAEAAKRGLEWRDEWFFEMPEPAE
jgi:transcriptional regulator with XRE-family HTH domain